MLNQNNAKHKRKRQQVSRDYYLGQTQVYRDARNEAAKVKYREDPIFRKHRLSYSAAKAIGITLEEYEEGWNHFFESQDGCCAICGRHQSDFKKSLGMDHDHVTGQIRGLLCTNCNLGLGLFKDDLELFERAMGYLMET